MPQQKFKKYKKLKPLLQKQRHTNIFLPDDIPEQSELNAWAVSKHSKSTILKKVKKSQLGLPIKRTFRKKTMKMAKSATNLGAPLIRENYVQISISNADPSHGSLADNIILHFGDNHHVHLNGRSSTAFAPGDTLKWDLNSIQAFMEGIPTDAWDDLMLETESRDGIKITSIKIVHSGETILDWNETVWLDNSTNEANRYISLTAQILQTKLDQIDHNWIAQIHWAAREIGKTDPTKYGTENAWCSEFASWALQKGKWATPDGNIGSQSMEDYFASIGRAHQVAEILNGTYTLNPGDYLRFEWSDGGQHSGIFMDFIDDPNNLSNSTRLKTIEGNTSSTVRVRTSRTLANVISCGNTR